MANNVPKTFIDLVLWGIIQLVTLPYHRFFTYNTLKPALEIQEWAARGIERNSPDRKKLHSLLCGWRTRKKDELAFVSVGAVAITAIVTASFSWPVIQESHWLAPGVWYGSLMTSVCGILIAAQQMSLLTLMGDLAEDPQAASSKNMQRHLNQILMDCPFPPRDTDFNEGTQRYSQQWVLSWKQIFTWQCPMMFFAYSTLLYFIGLTVIVCTPLIQEKKGPTINVAITYIVISGISWGLFAYCSLGGYRAITLDDDPDDVEITQVEEDAGIPKGGTPSRYEVKEGHHHLQ